MTSTSVPKLLAVLSAMLLLGGFAGFAQVVGAAGDDEASHVKFSSAAAAIFGKRCSACHTFGKGIKVGPDLKGVNERRKHDWLLKFIRSSSTVIKSGDAIATTLFTQFKQQRMPDWGDLSEQDVEDILRYLAIGGPDIKPPDERDADLASPADLERGRQLFYGEVRLRYGGAACSTCHTMQGARARGGSLGPDLTYAYERYRDQALTAFLRHPCFQWNNRTAEDRYLTPKESYALKAWLYQASGHQAHPTANNAAETIRAENGPAKNSQASAVSAAPVTRRH